MAIGSLAPYEMVTVLDVTSKVPPLIVRLERPYVPAVVASCIVPVELPVPMVTLESGGSAEIEPITNSPEFTFVPPVQLFDVEKVTLPEPETVKAPVPAMPPVPVRV